MFQYLVLLSFVLVNSTNVIITVPQLDVKKYLGHWLLVYQAIMTSKKSKLSNSLLIK